MSELSPEERAFLQSATSAWEPSAERARAMRAGIADRLGEAPDLGADAPAPPGRAGGMGTKAAARGPWTLGVGLALVGLCAAGVVWIRASASRPAAVVTHEAPIASSVVEPPSPAAHESAAPSPPAISIDALPNVAAKAPPSSAHRPPSTSIAAESSAGLAEELALLRRAQASLRDGSPDDTLATLANHATHFPQGVLRDERMTLQVLALCQRGDVDAARAVRAELERRSPGSNHLQRLAHSCAAP
ncbi:hypothetical protein AKJ09_11264 [Labilithrix luteola]|uniref:Uncharacterized protein n=1 Tax=Labilithrix luteola TaxID=1391654 RepID=A0A0K1QFP4_9BACT|nr:hypothetical protein [Labilithrix luteola]AKV04601.1 hypothetical protein AKJ09_11264 [Labilithrix luteola]